MRAKLIHTTATISLSLFIASAAACRKPEVPAEWKDLIPEAGLKPPSGDDPWVSVSHGEPRSIGEAKNRAHVLSMLEAHHGAAHDAGESASMAYTKETLTPDRLKKAFEEKLEGAGYRLIMTCDDSNAVV